MDEKSLKELTVLYVEDEPILRDEISKFLKRRVGNVLQASNGQEGLAMFEKYPVDLIITDLKMPVIDGPEMTKQIRLTDLNVPVIITTALSDIELMQSSIALGIERYLLKPIDVNELVSALESVQEKIVRRHNNQSYVMASSDDCMLMQRKIESEVARIIKSTSGKGPGKVNVFIRANIVEIVIAGSRTTIENTLLKSDSNTRISDYIRDIYYKQIMGEVESTIKQVTSYKAIWKSQNCNSQKDYDIIKFILEQ